MRILSVSIVFALVASASGTMLTGPVVDNFESYNGGAIEGQTNAAVGPDVSINSWVSNPDVGWSDITVGASAVPAGAGQAANGSGSITWNHVQFLNTPIDEGEVIFSFDMFSPGGVPVSMVTTLGGPVGGYAGVQFRADTDAPYSGFGVGGAAISGGGLKIDSFPFNTANEGLHVDATFDLDNDTLTVAYQGLGPNSPSGMSAPISIDSAFAFDLWGMHTNGGTSASFDNYQVSTFGLGAPPTEFTWNSDNLGDWNSVSNWNPYGIPDGPNIKVIFDGQISAPRTVGTDTAVSVRTIEFSSEHSYGVAGLGSVNMVAGTAEMSPPTEIRVLQGDHQFQAVVNLYNDTVADVATLSSLSFNNELNFNGNTLTKSGVGTLNINNRLGLEGGAVNVQEGILAGIGTVGGDLGNEGGTISPGNSLPGDSQSIVPEPNTLVLFCLGFSLFVIFSPFVAHGSTDHG